MLLRAIDFETTGIPPEPAGVCEMGRTDMTVLGDAVVGFDPVQHSTFVNPGHAIPPITSAVHHIIDSDVAGCPLFESAQAQEWLLENSPDVFVAHNAAFEKQFFNPPSSLWICTWKVSIILAPNAPGWNLQTLRYWLKLDVDRELASPPHRAGPDTYVTAHLVRRMLAKMPVEKMIEVSANPVMLPKLYFGEHSGKPIEEIPESYWNWIVHKAKGPWDENVMHTAKTMLERSRTRQRSRNPIAD